MASLPANATQEDIEEELDFQDVLIQSLDPGADDYADKRYELEAAKQKLERRLRHYHDHESGYAYHNGNTDHSSDQSSAVAQIADTGAPYDDNSVRGNWTQQERSKRPPPASPSLGFDRPYKRPMPGPSNVVTPSSSTESLEWISPLRFEAELSERAKKRQLLAEAALKRRRERESADERLARQLSDGQAQPIGASSSSSSASAPSFAVPTLQTTLNASGHFARPTPVSSQVRCPTTASQISALPDEIRSVPIRTIESRKPQFTSGGHVDSLKSEATLPVLQPDQLSHRPNGPTAVVDLTGSDSEDGVDSVRHNPADVVRAGQTTTRPADHRSLPRPAAMAHSETPRMPGAFPAPLPSYASQQMSNFPPPNPVPPQMHPGFWPNDNIYGQMRSLATGGFNSSINFLGSQASQLGSLINGSSSRPYTVYGDDEYGGYYDDDDENDDDLVYSGSRPRAVQASPYAGYNDHALYQSRFDEIMYNDPVKTKEEIEALLKNIRPDEELPEHLRVKTPEAMSITLHKYQELGLTWLQQCEDGSNKGGILADDMGLGKTIQMLSLIVTHKSQDPRCKTTLIVAPVALMRQWRQEIEQRVKGGHHRLSVFVQHGPSKKKDFRDLQVYDVVLTTFGSLAQEAKKADAFRLRQRVEPNARPLPKEKCALIGEGAKWYRVVLDEAQCIKNMNTQTAKAAVQLQASFRFCMTGTPMMNNVDELHSLIRFLRIKPYNEWTPFRRDFSTPMKSSHVETRAKSMRMLQTLCKAIMLRRTKTSTFEGKPILTLPERTTEIENPTFTEDEQSFYTALESRTQLQFNRYLQAGTIGKSYSAILVLLLRLRQACCHPHLITDFGVSAAADVTPEHLVTLAKELEPQVVARIKESNGNFECPVCYDAVTNPAIFIPCGHDTCSDCFARIADPANAIRDGNEDRSNARCPNCRAAIDPKRITDFNSFKRVYMPELLTAEEQLELQVEQEGKQDDDSDTASDDSETEDETESEDEFGDVDEKGDLAGFIVDDDNDSETTSEADSPLDGSSDPLGASKIKKESRVRMRKKSKGKQVQRTKSDKVKGKAKGKCKSKEKAPRKKKQEVSLADLKAKANTSAQAKKAYMRRLEATWITSAKVEKTLETLKGIMDDAEREKVLIFSQWTSLLDLLEIPIAREGWGYRRYDGSMNVNTRADAVDDFRDNRKDVRIMLVSLKAGNAGLNLNMASQVIILDPFWNPYIEEQAIDRAHRIGQSRPVKVHRMLIKSTVEDRIVALQEEKRALISEALDEQAGQNIARLGAEELAYLFGVRGRPVAASPSFRGA